MADFHHPKYSQAIRRNEHSYGEYIENIDLIKVAEEQLRNSDTGNLVEKIAEMFYCEHRKELPDRKTKKAAYQKAKSLVMRNQKGHRKLLPEFNDKKGYRKAIKDSIELGYIRDIQFDLPWHPKIWSDPDKLTTIPWQHKYAVLYTGRKALEFTSREFTRSKISKTSSSNLTAEEKSTNVQSILKKGYISPDSRHSLSKEKAEEWTESNEPGGGSPKIWGIYLTTDVKYTTQYALPQHFLPTEPVLEVEVPTKFLVMPGPSKSNVAPGSMKRKFIKSREDYFNERDSPKDLEELHHIGNKAHGENEIIYTHRDSNNKPVLPLQYVTGVWESAEDEHPYFRPLKEYIDRIYSVAREPDERLKQQGVTQILPSRQEIKLDIGASKKREFERKKHKRDETRVKLLKISEHLSEEFSSACADVHESIELLKSGKEVKEYGVEVRRDLEFKNVCKAVVRMTVLSAAIKKSLELIEMTVQNTCSFQNASPKLLERNKKIGEELVEESEKIHRYINQQNKGKPVEEAFREHMKRYSELTAIVGHKKDLEKIAKSAAKTREELKQFRSEINWRSRIDDAITTIEYETGLDLENI